MPVTSWESEVIRRLDALVGIGGISSGGGGGGDLATATNQQQLVASLNQFLGENATEARQQDAIALLKKLFQQLDFANRSGTVNPSFIEIATSNVKEILPASGIRKRVRITNHAQDPEDFILIDLNANASLTKGQIIASGQTWESPGREEARARITVVSGSTNNIQISYQETLDSVFSIGELEITNKNLDLADVNYPVTIVGATEPLLSVTALLYESGIQNPIAEQIITTNLVPDINFVITFPDVQAFNNDVLKFLYLELTGINQF